jgi:hypothetical protein
MVALLKNAVVEGCAYDHLITVEGAASGGCVERLGNLRDLLKVTAGQKIAYVTDVPDTPSAASCCAVAVEIGLTSQFGGSRGMAAAAFAPPQSPACSKHVRAAGDGGASRSGSEALSACERG